MSRESYPVSTPDPPPMQMAPGVTQEGWDGAFRHLRNYIASLLQWMRSLALVANGARAGKLNCVGDVTLTANATSTTLTDERIGPYSCISFMPTTANAATAKAGLYVGAQTSGSATLTHASSANTDQTFIYQIIG